MVIDRQVLPVKGCSEVCMDARRFPMKVMACADHSLRRTGKWAALYFITNRRYCQI
jgi:hypothetical protein